MAVKKKTVSKLASKVKQIRELPKSPLWKGPLEDGITQSMLGGFLVCPELGC